VQKVRDVVSFKESALPILRCRKYLPHLESPDSTYFVTFRLTGSVPEKLIDSWRSERLEIIQPAEKQRRQLSKYEKERLEYLFSKNIERYLDQLHGECWLKDQAIAQLVVDTLKYFDGVRYRLHVWCVMPNHVHVVFTAISKGGKFDSDLIPILHSWKSYTAHRANKILRRQGAFWQNEYHDHVIRSDEDFAHCIDYTLLNPVKARLCQHWQQWQWSGCSEKIWRLLTNRS
jgi:REP element-mobilizing transposase RayT